MKSCNFCFMEPDGKCQGACKKVKKSCDICKDSTAGCVGACVPSDHIDLRKPFPNYGWICPVCGTGMSPHASKCECKATSNVFKVPGNSNFWGGNPTHMWASAKGKDSDTGDFRDQANDVK